MIVEAQRIHYYERVASTMDVVHHLAEQGAAAGTIVLAGEQLEGRGSRGRTWHSPPGGLWVSLLLRPATIAGLEIVSLRVGLALAAVLEGRTGCPIQLKWPNDLIADGRKLGGILCEARWHGEELGWVAVGIGINVQNAVPEDLHHVAIALGQLKSGVTASDLVDPVVAALRDLDLSPDRLSSRELLEYQERDWLSGLALREPVEGLVIGVNDDGSLAVRTPAGELLAVRSGSVEVAVSAGNG